MKEKEIELHVVPDPVVGLADAATELANRPLSGSRTYDQGIWQRDIDQWLADLRLLKVGDQVRLIARLRSFGEAPERGLIPLRESALAQIHTQQADQLSAAAGRLSLVGIAIALVGVGLAVVQVWIAS